MPAPFRVLVTSGVFEPGSRGGGPVRSVANIVDGAPEHIEVTLVTRDRDVGASEPYEGLSGRWVTRGRVRVYYLDISNPSQWVALWKELRRTRFDLLYVNSLFDPWFTLTPVLVSRMRGIRTERLLIAPRGQLSPGALGIKATKKQAFLRYVAPRLRHRRTSWHAFTPREAEEIRTILPWAQILVNENQTSLPPQPIPAPERPKGAVRLVFIGRISVKKNLDLALRALAMVDKPVALDIYGPIEDPRYWAECEELISSLPERVRVDYRGEVSPRNVRRTFAQYDAFLFPTRGENFGHVIAESLSASCPVICSAHTPWTEILKAGGGRVIYDLSPEGLGAELSLVAALGPPEVLRARLDAGRAYVAWRALIPARNVLEQARVALGRDSEPLGYAPSTGDVPDE